VYDLLDHVGSEIESTDILTTPQGATIGTSYADQNGTPLSYLGLTDSTWYHEVADMSAYAGNAVQLMLVAVQPGTQPGAVNVWNQITLTPVGEAGGALSTTPRNVNAGTGVTLDYNPITMQSAEATNYYLDDHLGTTQMEMSAGGWPVWEGQFSPFGAELPDGTTAMRYKFTGKERDSESGLDNSGARYYSSSMGRFNSPDPSGRAFADPGHPKA
jgi:RHS repeat-associated protein